MDKAVFLFKVFPFLAFLLAGINSILEVFFPSIRDVNFYRWEIDEGERSYIQFMGWRKVLQPPRVIAQGFMSERAACITSLVAGVVFVAISIFGIRHVTGFPAFVPDLFGKI